MDYYQILDVSKTASLNEIKKAYRKEAMKHHPDRGGDAVRFRQISEAYNILSDSNKRDLYDAQQLEASFSSYNTQTNPFTQDFGFWSEHIYEKNKDIKLAANVQLADIVNGKTFVMQYRVNTPNGAKLDTVTVEIPKGAKHGDTIRYHELGHALNPQMTRGDLRVAIYVLEHKDWTREGNNLISGQAVNALDLITGCVTIVRTLDNKTFQVTIPAGTRHGQVFSIKQAGIADLQTGKRGNVHVVIEAKIPDVHDSELLNQIREIRNKL